MKLISFKLGPQYVDASGPFIPKHAQSGIRLTESGVELWQCGPAPATGAQGRIMGVRHEPRHIMIIILFTMFFFFNSGVWPKNLGN